MINALSVVAIILIITLFILLLFIIYLAYQIKRNDAIYNIRIKWIYTKDKRYSKYSYDYMFEPNYHNLFGLIYPKDEYYN